MSKRFGPRVSRYERLEQMKRVAREVFTQADKEIATLTQLLRDIRADGQCAHWHEEIDATIGKLT